MTTICIDCRYLGERPSGIGEVVRSLVDHAPSLAPDLQFLLLRNPRHPGPLSNAPNVREEVVSQAANGPATMWWLPQVADLRGVDLFHATFNILPGALAMPTLTTVHDIMWLTRPQWCKSGALGLVERAFYSHGIRRALRQSDHIATVSAASRDSILSLYPELASRISVTLSGVSPRFRPMRVEPSALEALGIAAGRRFILTVGQYAPYKNHEGAIEAFAQAFADESEVDLVLVQRQGHGRQRLLELASRLGIAERIKLVGSVGGDDLIQLYSAACALLHPSFCEGFGNPVAEAMACGCPVITSNISAMPEVSGAAARLVPPHDHAAIAAALREVVHDAELAARMRGAGLARAAELDWRDFARANVGLYRKVLAGA